MKIKMSLLDLLGKEVYAVYERQDRIFVLALQKIETLVFSSKENKVFIKTDTGFALLAEEDVCLDLEQVKARINLLQKSIPIIKPEKKIILTK